jgi:ketosteroid isomerase-like protein
VLPVSAANVELVRSIYEAWAEGRSARAFIAEDVEYVNPHDAIESGVLRGRKSFARIRDAYDDVRIAPERYLEAGDEDVVVIAKLQVGTRGLHTETTQGYVWTVRDGQAVRFRWFNDPTEALAAVGLQHESGA